MCKAVVICGEYGPLAISVAQALSQKYSVTVVAKDEASQNIKDLIATEDKCSKISIVTVPNMSKATLSQHVTEAHVVFATTPSDNSREEGIKEEISCGEAIGDACVECGVEHVVYSTQLSVVNTTGVRARHLDAKATIMTYMRRQGLPVTGIIVPCVYQQLLTPPMRPTKTAHNQYYLDFPTGSTPIDLMSAEDVGPVVASIVSNRSAYLGKTVSVSGDKLTVREMATIMTRQLVPKQFVDKQFTLNQYQNKSDVGIADLASMFDFYCRVDQRSNPDLTRRLNPNTKTFEQWLQQNKCVADKALEYELPQRVNPWL